MIYSTPLPFPKTFLQHHLQILLEIVHTRQTVQALPDEPCFQTCPLTIPPHNKKSGYLKAEISS